MRINEISLSIEEIKDRLLYCFKDNEYDFIISLEESCTREGHKKIFGDYNIGTRHIQLYYTRHNDIDSIMMTALHELAHHIYITHPMFKTNKGVKNLQHNAQFCTIHDALIIRYREKYVTYKYRNYDERVELINIVELGNIGMLKLKDCVSQSKGKVQWGYGSVRVVVATDTLPKNGYVGDYIVKRFNGEYDICKKDDVWRIFE